MTQSLIDAWIDANHGAQVEFLREVVRVPTDTPPGDNAAAARRVKALLAAQGFEATAYPVEAAALAPLGLASVENLVVREVFDASGPTIALNAHGDVVPPGDGWTVPPYEGVVKGGRMYGRGVAVSKSDFATYTFALAALRHAVRYGARLRGAVELHFTYDEEFGGLVGPARLLSQGVTKPDLAICAGFSYSVITAHNGCLQLEVTILGRSAHGAMPETGADALRAANAVLSALYGEAERIKAVHSKVAGITHPTLIVGRIEGGTNTNVVPDRVVLKLDRRLIPEEDPAAVEPALKQLIENAVKGHDSVRVEFRRLLLSSALKPLPGHEKLSGALQAQALRVLGEKIPAVGVPLYTDARLYSERGIPTVLYGAGPRTILEANAKRADENLSLEDLRQATKVVAGALADLLAAR